MCTADALAAPDAYCTAGYYCVAGTISALTPNALGYAKDCPAGYYCPEGSPMPVPCPAGTYNTLTNKVAETDCTLCTAGFYCIEIARATAPTDLCLAGFYCPEGSTHETMEYCPVAHSCPTGSAAPVPCLDPDFYQDETGAEVCKQCPAGHECTSV